MSHVVQEVASQVLWSEFNGVIVDMFLVLLFIRYS